MEREIERPDLSSFHTPGPSLNKLKILVGLTVSGQVTVTVWSRLAKWKPHFLDYVF